MVDLPKPLDLAAVFDHLPNAFMVLDRELRFVAANPAYLRSTAASLEAILGRHVFEVFPDDPTDPNNANVVMMRASFERVVATGQSDEIAAIPYLVPRTPGGPLELRIWSTRHTPILDAAGRTLYLVQEATEVTHLQTRHVEALGPLGSTVLERAVRAQAAAASLDAQIRSLRHMFEQAPGFMCFLRGPTHIFEIVNNAYRQLFGHRDVVGITVAEALPEVVAQGFTALLDGVFESGEPFLGRDLRVELMRTPGAPSEESFVDFIYQPSRDATGQIVGIFVQGQDVTAKHLAQREIEVAAMRRRFLIEAIPVQVWTSKPDGALDFVSQRVALYFDTTADALIGSGWLAVLHPDDVPQVVARWTHSLTTGDPYEVELRLRRGDGMYRWHLGRATAERDDSDAIIRWFGTNTDIHDAKIAAAELRARSEYEQRLIGIVSHDLRSPLGAIGLAASMLAELPLPPAAARTVVRLARSADRATRLITDLLDFAKARIGTTIPINPRPTNLREIVEQVVDEFQLIAPARTIRVGHAGAEDGSWDADRIAQVLSNLVGNALQHGSPTVPIVVESRIDGDAAVFAVRNEGPVIPATELAHLFEPFKRGSHAGAAGGSMGLGLFIAREVVVAHGGTIEVESRAGVGTCFTVRLPRFAAAAAV